MAAVRGISDCRQWQHLLLSGTKKIRKNSWKVKLVGADTSDEDIGVGDIDGGGDLDFTAGQQTGEQRLTINNN